MKNLRRLFIIIAALFFYTILLSSFVRNIYLSADAGGKWGFLARPVKFMAELPSLTKRALEKPEFYAPNTDSKDGLDRVSSKGTEQYPKLLVSYKDKEFGQKFDLIDLPTGKLLKQWQPDNAELYDKGFNPKNPENPEKGSDLYFFHPLLMPDSSLIVNSQLTSLLARVGKDNEIMWFNNDRRYHHTTELDHEGNIYSCTRPFVSGQYDIFPENYDAYKDVLVDDAITKIDPETGEILSSKSVIQILLDNGYGNLLVNKGQVISDMTHLNDIQPALYDSDYWLTGDLLVSCRNLSTVFLYRPATNTVLWLKTGPWLNQHDVDFYGNTKIVVFGNDVIREESPQGSKITTKPLYFSEKNKNNDIYVYDFAKDTVTTPYSRLMESEKIRTLTSGRCDILPNGDIFVEDTNNGRLVFGDTLRKKMEYVKRIDDNHISRLFWSRLVE